MNYPSYEPTATRKTVDEVAQGMNDLWNLLAHTHDFTGTQADAMVIAAFTGALA